MPISHPLVSISMKMTRRFFALWCALFMMLSVPALAQEGSQPITATDLLNIRQIGDVSVSPDGRLVIYSVRKAERTGAEGEEDYSYRTHLYLLSVQDHEWKQLTYGDRGGSQPAWHPESDRIAFVRSVEGKPQIFILPLYGGESYQLTQVEHGATAPRWSPDGTQVLFTSTLTEEAVREQVGQGPDWPDERPGRRMGDARGAEPSPDGSLREVRAWLDKNAEDANPRVFTRLNLQGELDLAVGPRYRHLFVIDAEEEEAEPVALTRGFYSFGGGNWVPNSRQILLSGAPVADAHPDRVRDSDLFIVNPDGTNFRKLLDIEGYALSNPMMSPDSRMMAFTARDLDDPGYAQAEVGLFSLDGRTPPEMLTLGFDRSLQNLRWSRNNWFLFYTAPSEGGFPLYRLSVLEGRPTRSATTPPAVADSVAADSVILSRAVFSRDEIVVLDPKIERMTSKEEGIRSFDVSDATAYFVLTEPSNPYELYASTMEFKQRRRLTEHNAAWLQKKRLSLPREYTVKRDTLEIQYWVMEPTFAQRRQEYPMLLEIHGGPSAMWGPGEVSMWHEFQLMAAKGYGVVYANPRGSGGYGHDFKALNYQDWGDGPGGDVLAVATDAARKQRWVDENRQVVTGGSYAGYLTAWIVGHDDRFKAAVAQRGVYDLAMFFGEGNAWRLVPNHFGGYPWETEGEDESAYEILRYNSPLTYVADINTPLLIMHADNDLRTGVIQSEVLYKSLKVLGKPVEYVRYPDAGHDLSRTGNPKQRIDRLLRIYEFMERYVGDDSAFSSQ